MQVRGHLLLLLVLAAMAAVALAVSPPFESRFAEVAKKSSEKICEMLKRAAPKTRAEGVTACHTWSLTLLFSKEYHEKKCANLVLPWYLWAMDEYGAISCDAEWFAEMIQDTKDEWHETKTAVPGAAAQFENYIGHKRIGLEVELASTRIFAYDPAQVENAVKVGAVNYGHSVAKTAAEVVGLPIMHVTLDGVAAEGTTLADNKGALAAKFKFNEDNFQKDVYGYQGLIELVTGPVPNGEIEPLLTAMDKLFATISEVTECQVPVVGATNIVDGVPVFGKSVKFQAVVDRYNQALTNLHATKYNNYKLGNAEYEWANSAPKVKDGYQWYMPCAKWTYNKENQNNQINYQIPLSAVNSDAYVGFYYNAMNPNQMVYGEKAFRGCRSSALAYAATLPDGLKDNDDVKGLLTLVLFNAHTSARLSMFMGDVTATVTKDTYDQLYKVNIPDIVRTLPKDVRQKIFTWWGTKTDEAHSHDFVTLLRRPENEGGAPIFKEDANAFWNKVDERLQHSLPRIFMAGAETPYTDSAKVERHMPCWQRYHDEEADQYGDAVDYDFRPENYEENCMIAGLSKVLPVFTAPTSAKLSSHVSIVVEARKAASPLNAAFKTPVDFNNKPAKMTELFELQKNAMA